ncbi:putative ATP-dependent RNA helicase TDRD12 [Musca domestica]|uniref:Probable ATP-dependent RNA helicase spindle-E n=1 Tax=Musca domestica TaxID=7370 RepID=A0ABM3URN0_MUSDO|nr:putative ATP-dependent RNA helicase TDRD12 [Musca domestica]XP_058976200.1 putative ATP-dependent RNA helicase TDRD12 [Musca domestica]
MDTMNMENSEHTVAVTHFINPHLFWYRKIGGPDDNFHILTLLEERLQTLYRCKPAIDRCRLDVGDIVAVNFVVWNKYIRAEILQKGELQQEEYIVWAIDYGFPLLSKREHLRYLPEALANRIGHIYRGGVANIQPAVLDYDHIESNLVMAKQDEWLQRSCDMFEKLLSDASCIVFVEKFQTANDHHWGELIISNHKGNKFNAHTYLQAAKFAIDVDPQLFPKMCVKLKTTSIAPWLSNNRNSKFKINSIKHNMAEHSNKMNSAIIDECAKRKVEDWCARNALVQVASDVSSSTEHLESSGAESGHDHNIDDITFDDSVSVIHEKNRKDAKYAAKIANHHHEHKRNNTGDEQAINFLGKAGKLTKLKQQKYSKHNLPPQAESQAFAMNIRDRDEIEFNETFNLKAPKPAVSAPTIISSASGSTNASTRMRRLADVRMEQAREAKRQQQRHKPAASDFVNQNPPNSVASGGVSTDDGGDSVVSIRQQRLVDLRKKYSQREEETKPMSLCEKNITSPTAPAPPASSSASGVRTISSRTQRLLGMRQKYQLHDSAHSIESPSTINKYELLEQSTTGMEDSNLDKTQDTQDSSAGNIYSKLFGEMEAKLLPSSVNTTTDNSLIEAMTSCKLEEHVPKDKATFDIFKAIDSKTKPKTSRISSDKESQSAYDGLTLVPAGFDITRLQKYRDEENHWHRKKSTRHETIPHDDQTVSSSEEFLIHNDSRLDQSGSSSDFFQIKPPAVKQNSTHNSKRLTRPVAGIQRREKPNEEQEKPNILDQSIPSIVDTENLIKPVKCSQQLESKPKRKNSFNGTYNAYDSLHASEISTSSTINSTVSSEKHLKRKLQPHHHRQLKSPETQISKIDEILQQHFLEKERGNTNILDLKNSITSPQRSQISSSAASMSHRDNINEKHSNTHTSSSSSESFMDKLNLSNSSLKNSEKNLLPMGKSPENKHMKNIYNYNTLLEVKRTEHLPIIEGEVAMQTKFIDHLVLAHSSVPLEPIENVAEAPFLSEIYEEMRNMRVNKVYRIQVYSWSHVLRGNSLFVVNPARSGKTWSYLPALCSVVSGRYQRIKDSYGPVAIILVASSKHVESVNGYCRRLMSGLKSEAPSCVPSYGMRNFIDTKVQLLNGCGILIATPSSLLRLLRDNSNEPLFDSERLEHIVIDDMDIMLSRSHEDFESAVRIVFKLCRKSKYKTLRPQLIVTSRDWDGVMIRLIRKSNQPLLLIGDFLEAAVYGRAGLSVKLKSSQEKNDTIFRFIKKTTESLEGDLEHGRMLIMCNSDEDVQTVVQFITECGYPCLPYYNRSTDSEQATVDEWKNKVSSQILVCTDARFPELKIQNVYHLIHYSMPTSWTQFTTRFSALAQTYDNFVSKKFEEAPLVATASNTTRSLDVSAHSMILLDEDNSLQLPRLVDFLRKHNQAVHSDILAVSKRVLIEREESRLCKGILLCPQLLEFGECDDTRCDKRHELTRFDVVDESENIPTEGEMRIHILKVFSPTHYAARLLLHKPPNSTKWREIRRSGENLTFSVQMDQHYRNEENLALHWPPRINDLCMYKYGDNFRRALILEAPDLVGRNVNIVQANLKVTLKLVDVGIVINSVKCSELFICDDKFKEFPHQAIDIRLMNIVPFDNERSWDSKTTKQVQNWIMDEIKADHVVQVGITFALAQTIWVNNLVVMEKLSTLGTYRPYVNLKLSLIKRNFAPPSKGERKHVRDIALEYGLLKPSSNGVSCETSNIIDTSLEDYESCQSDLIKFSSSNGDALTNTSMESFKNNSLEVSEKGEQSVPEEKQKQDKSASEKEINPSDATKSNGNEENWDELQCDDPVEGKERGEIYLPLTTASPTSGKPETKQESWSQLPLNDLTKVEIGDEGENGNWENIFLQIIDKKHMAMFDDLVELINRHVSNLKAQAEKEPPKRIYDFEPLHNCIVKYDNMYLRAKVHGVFGTSVKKRLYRFFLCDYACFTNAKSNELYNDFLYETTDEIVSFIPYQAVHCTLAGIQLDRFAKRYKVTKEYLYACAVEQRTAEEKMSLSLNNLNIYSYKILLYECEKSSDFSNAEMFNRTLVDKGITSVDENDKHYLKYKLCLDDDDDNDANGEEIKAQQVNTSQANTSSSSDISEVYTFEQLIECIEKSHELDKLDNNLLDEATTSQVLEEIKECTIEEVKEEADKNKISSKQDSPLTTKKPPQIHSELDDDEEDHCTTEDDSDNKKSSASITSSNDDSYIKTPPPILKALYKRPMTTWYETDCLIFISIYAPDIVDYNLEVTQKTVYLHTSIQGEEYVVFLHLLGSIDPQQVSHEIKGLNVIIRLVKNVFVPWPRLLQESTKYSWLKFNYNAIASSELEYIMPQQRLQAILENTPNIDESRIYDELDSDDSEKDRFQTFNPIETNADDYDPFSI